MKLFEDIFSTHSLVIVVTASMLIIVCLVVLVGSFWAFGPLVIAVALWQILIICTMGSAFQTSCEKFSEKLYAIEWHRLSPRNRTFLVILMQMAQHPRLHTIGGIMESNLSSFMLVSV